MNFDKYSISCAKNKNIKCIQFSIPDNDEILRSAVVEIFEVDIYDKNYPKINGLYDLRMGTTDKQYKCQTCNCDILNCTGHHGVIKLETPVYNIHYQKTVYKILQCICMVCSHILIKVIPKQNLNIINDQIKKCMVCEHCGFVQPKWFMNQQIISYEFPNNSIELITCREVQTILSKMSDQTVSNLGFNPFYSHPKNMLISNLLVPPPIVRPSVVIDNIMKSQDDLTHKLLEILKTNIQLSKLSSPPQHVLQEYINLLQYHITTYLDNNLPGIPQATQRTGRPIKSLSQRIKSKEGRVRGNLMGKRVDFSARTVITADPCIDLDELGVPWNISKNMTISENVNRHNIDILQRYVDNGPNPKTKFDVGANYVVKESKKKDLRFCKNVTLEIGDIVDRHIRNGDYVIFNRQPSLHKMSMMGHKVRVMDHNTYRLNLSSTSPYNADFDGDEMNMHVPQNWETISEVKELMMVSKCIVSPQSNKPVMGIVQDALLSCRKLSMRNEFLTKSDLMNLMMVVNKFEIPKPCILKPVPLWSGKQLIQLIIPKISIHRYSGWHDEEDTQCFSENDTELLIDDGEYIMGTLCKKSLGTSSGSIIHLICTELSNEEATRFISDIQYIANKWIMKKGFSVGIKDTLNKTHITKSVKNIVNEAIDNVNDNIKLGIKNGLKPSQYENKINSVLNKARDNAGTCVQKELDINNNFYAMVTSGSKGSIINISQIMACVGQQNVSGKRVDYGYNERTLPHFTKNDNSANSRGFVNGSYVNGLSPNEFFFHAMAGREGIIDTAVKTSETGYIQRRLVKAMEDLHIANDKTVRNSINDVIQFVYGDDNMDGCKLITQYIDNIKYHLPFNISIITNKLRHFQSDKLLNYDIYDLFMNNIQCYNILYNNIFHKIFNYEKIKFVSESGLKWLKEEILFKLSDGQINEGESVGTIAAQSIGEPVTQMTLNTFHSAGISEKNVTLGVPRLKELINVTKNIKSPTMYIHLDKDNNTDIQKISSELEYTNLKKYVTSYFIYFDKDLLDFENSYYNLSIDFKFDSKWCIVLNVDEKLIVKDYLSMIKITTILNMNVKNIWCTSNFESDNNCVIVIRIIKNIYDYETVIIMINKVLNDITIKGIDNVQKVYINNNKLETDGTNLMAILENNNILIDKYNSYSNDILEVYELLGVEATRNILLKEMKNVIEFDGSYVNYRHLALLLDTMTYKGGVMAITRHGINRIDTGPLMRCSFEETVNVLTNAAMYSQRDNVKGVTENIMLGKLSTVGTGMMKLLIDPNKLINENEFRPSTPNRNDEYYSSFYPLKDLEI